MRGQGHGTVLGNGPGQLRPGLFPASPIIREMEATMPTVSESRFKEADLLARAVENVLRKLIRVLVGRITLVKLQEMIRFIYVDETEKKLKSERPGKNVPLTRLALNTGLDTRTLTRVREKLYGEEKPYGSQFLAELTPESAVCPPS